MKGIVGSIHRFFIPKTYWADEVLYRKTRIFVNTCILTSLFALSYLVVASLFGMRHSVPMLIASFIVFILCIWLLKYGVKFTICSNIYIAMAYVSAFWHAAFDGGVTSGVLPWICITPVAAMVFNNQKNGWFWVIASMLGVTIMGILQMSHIIFVREMKADMLYIFIASAYSGLAFIIFLFALISENAYTGSLVKLDQKNQDIQWEKALAEQERQRAEQSEKFKQQFLANMTHEIRTPMNAIIGLTNILAEKNPTPEQLGHLKIIQKSSANLLNIINDILDLSKIEAGKIDLEKIEFSIRDVLDSVEQTFKYKIQEKNLAFKIDYDKSIPPVMIGDPTRLTQILMNLVSNAIKFTEKGTISINVIKEGNRIHFTVSDTGIGMTWEQIGMIFEPFKQADASTTRKYGGTGLGLYISQQLAHLYGSELTVKSTPGSGSNFSFSIEYSDGNNRIALKKESDLNQSILKKLEGLKILVADDNEFNRVVAVETLQMMLSGAQIDIALNGKEAIINLPGHDIVLMDINMPEMDGYEATRKIRTELGPPYNTIPIIALTASVVESDYNKCFAAGMNDIVPKPFKADELLLAIYNALYTGTPTISIDREKNVSAPANEHVTNLETLKLFCVNDNVRIKKYINIYLDSAPKNLTAIKKHLKDGDYTSLHATAHTFKSHLKYMGMKGAAILAEEMEKNCLGDRDNNALKSLLDRIEIICNISYVELKEYV